MPLVLNGAYDQAVITLAAFCLHKQCTDNPGLSSDFGLVAGVAVFVIVIALVAAVCIAVLVVWWRYVGHSNAHVKSNVAATQMYTHNLSFLSGRNLCLPIRKQVCKSANGTLAK